MFRGLLESRHMDVTNAGTNHKVNVHAVARNLITYYVEINRLLGAFAQDGDLNGGAFGAFEQLSHIAGAHVVGGLAVHGDNYVAGPDAGSIRRSARKWRNDDNLVVARPNLHAHAIVLSALFLAQRRVRLRIEEVGVRIEHSQHSRNGTVVDGLIGIDRLSVILLHHLIDLREAANA